VVAKQDDMSSFKIEKTPDPFSIPTPFPSVEEFDKLPAVNVISEDGLTLIAARGDVVVRSFVLNPQRPCHGFLHLPKTIIRIKSPDPTAIPLLSSLARGF
jgi:hypothetical protein